MRNDLSPAFVSAKDSSTRKPRQLLVLQFPIGGNIYLSDQDIVLGGITYRGVVESWGEITESYNSTDTYFTAETRQVSIVLFNGGNSPISDMFLREDPENVEALLYQWFEGLADSDKELIDRFVVQDPIKFDELSRLLTLDLVTANMRYGSTKCGNTVSLVTWPNAKLEDVGKYIPLLYGSTGECKGLYTRASPSATLKGSIAATSTTILCNEPIDGFPASGTIQIEDELIQYSSRTSTQFTVYTRGYGGTIKVAHPDNTKVYQYINTHTFIFGEATAGTITGMKVDGYPSPSGIYYTAFSNGYATAVFNQKPYSWQYASTSQEYLPSSTDWVTSSVNTALYPHYAYDDNEVSSSALVNATYPKLAIQLASGVMPDKGLIVAAYLEVHHWASNVYSQDFLNVYIDGIGVLGALARPSADDVVDLSADVDIDHPHTNTQPGLTTTDPTHLHTTDATQGRTNNGAPADFSHGISSNGAYGTTKETYIWFDPVSIKVASSMLTINVSTVSSGTARIDFIELIPANANEVILDNFSSSGGGANGSFTIAGGSWSVSGSSAKYLFRVRTGLYVNNGSITVYYSTPVISYNKILDDVDNSASNTSTAVTTNAVVNSLATENRVINFTTKKSAARTLVERFDITDYLTPTWSWFEGRRVEIRYINAGSDSVNVFIPWINFVVEYRAKERVFSDDITASIVTTASSRPDLVITDLLIRSGIPSEYIDAVSFNSAGTYFNSRQYTIDGVIDGSITIQEALKKVCRQSRSRLFWSGGKVKLVARLPQVEQVVGKYLSPVDYQLRSLKAERQPVRNVINNVELSYLLDRISGEYKGISVKSNTASITAHGKREDKTQFEFDLVRSESMANDLAQYYVDTLSSVSTFYSFNAYLSQEELEKEDVIGLTSSGFNRMRKMPAVIRTIERVFGSGKNRVINHLRIVAECLHYILLEGSISENVSVLDSIDAILGANIDFSEQVLASDSVFVTTGRLLSDNIASDESLSILWSIVNSLSESIPSNDDSISFNIVVGIDDSIRVLDDITAWKNTGFGSGEFGNVAFGGFTFWDDRYPEYVALLDDISSHISVVISDTVTATDSVAGSSGFGSPNGDGFSIVPFGR